MLSAIAGCAAVLSTVAVQAAGVNAANIHFGPQDKYTGYLAHPAGHGPFPGIVVIHEWWGLNDNIKNEAKKLAESGYVALAVDLFGKTTTDPKESMRMVQGVKQPEATAQLLAAAQYLRTQKYVRPDKVGSIGWCFGGGQSLTLALSDPRLAAAVIYYGQPVTDARELKKIHAAVLGICGEADQSIPIEKAREFNQGLADVKVVHEFYSYPGAGHAFANPSGGNRYKPEAAKDAWKKTLAFLRKHLEK